MRILMMLLVSLTLLAQRPVPVDNEWARVIVATTAPGPKGQMHKHDRNRVMVYLDKGAQTIEYEGGGSKVISARAGEVQDLPPRRPLASAALWRVRSKACGRAHFRGFSAAASLKGA